MPTARRELTRRRFLGTASAATVMAAGRLPRVLAGDPAKPPQRKTILSFYCDDTSPYAAGVEPFQTFLDYCAEQGIAGESSTILGMGGHSMCLTPNEGEQEFLHQVARAWKCGIGTHMELMTHGALFDFVANRPRKDARHEGIRLAGVHDGNRADPQVSAGASNLDAAQRDHRPLSRGRRMELLGPELAALRTRS